MDVTTEEEAQAVLLEGMEGTQYITIQRADGEALTKGVPLFTLSGELLSEGMVVDMINAGVASEYTSGTEYFETEDLLPHELTEEDRRLAAALVAVQMQQQQKHQQIHSHQEDATLSDVAHLDNLEQVNAYSIEAMPESAPTSVYPALQAYKRVNHVKEEFQVKSEEIISAESGEETAPVAGPKRLLPHKKRIPRKLKQQSKKSTAKKEATKASEELSRELTEPIAEVQLNIFKCELCENLFSSQITFFEHLKSHYEPVKKEGSANAKQTAECRTNTANAMAVQIENNVLEEFSEPEDLMEGIRGVVEKTGADIDDESESLPDVNGASWPASENMRSESGDEESTINKDDLCDTKKKKAKTRKQRSDLTCRHCERSFHHKNSLVYHMRSHSGERPHQCEVCGKSFFAASALKVHKRLHSGDKPYKCEDCGRQFRQWGDLKYHSTSLHSEQKQFQCEYCGKDFARKYSLIVHRRIHTGEKNYRCEYCNKTFRASSYLQNHRRIHTGEKPHPCTVCGKPFRVRSDMKRHMYTHSRSKSDRPLSKKAAKDEKDKKSRLQDLVHELKLEVEPNNVVSLVPAEDNPESILPHSDGNLEYSATASSRDSLEASIRSSDSLQYFFM